MVFGTVFSFLSEKLKELIWFGTVKGETTSGVSSISMSKFGDFPWFFIEDFFCADSVGFFPKESPFFLPGLGGRKGCARLVVCFWGKNKLLLICWFFLFGAVDGANLGVFLWKSFFS